MASRQTKQKELLQSTLVELPSFFNADNLYVKVISIDSSLGIATVYRFLKEQVELGLLHSYMCDRKTVYSKTKQHCHFINEETGEVTHFHIDNLDFLKHKIPGNISSFSIEVKGR